MSQRKHLVLRRFALAGAVFMCCASGCSVNLDVDDASCEKSHSSILRKLKDEVKPDMEKATTADAYRETLRKYDAWATQANADVGPCTGLAIGEDNAQDEHFWHKASPAVGWLKMSVTMSDIDGNNAGWQSGRDSLLRLIDEVYAPPPTKAH